ncbi:MAG: carboxypeptidase-like regulatory domain-containing protein [Terriglobia bacterium]|jgi:hypothetical protein
MVDRRVFRAGMIIALLCGAFAFGGQSTIAQTATSGPQSPLANAPAGSISGRVYRADTGAPLPGNVLTLHLNRRPVLSEGPPGGPPTARSGPEGGYAFASVDPGSYSIQIWPSAGFVTPEPPIQRVMVPSEGGAQNIDFRLQPAGVISGSVHDEYNDPLQGMAVSVFCQNPNLNPATVAYPGYGETYALTDDQGNFRVSPLAPGHCYIAVATNPPDRGPLVRAKFYPNADSMETAQLLEVKPGEEISNIRFQIPLALMGNVGILRVGQQVLPPPSTGAGMGSVSGHIYRADTGAPIAGAIIQLIHHFDPAQIEGSAPVFSPQAARTGTDGAYAFACVEPGAYTIRLQRQGFAPMSGQQPTETDPGPSQISLESGQHMDNLDYRLQPTGVISGTVHDQDGVPLQGLTVTAFCSRPSSTNENRPEAGQAVVDDRGDFRISGVPPGDCYVGTGTGLGPVKPMRYSWVYYPNEASMEKAQLIPVKPEEETRNIRFIYRYSLTYTITVKVVNDGNGGGDNRYLVRIMSSEPGAMRMVNTPQSRSLPPVMTHPDGTAVVRGVSPGRYTIGVNPLREVIGGRGPVLRRPDGTVDTRGPTEHHAWVPGAGAGGSAMVQVVDRDLSIEVPLSSFPPGGVPR